MSSRDVLDRPADPPDAVLRYADHDDGLVDIHLPPAPGPHRLVVLVHGGFWAAAFDRRHTRPMSSALAGAGFVVAVPEYRRVGAGGGWPATLDDVDAAMTALPGLLAGVGIGTTSTTCVGHSAGGHLVLWLATRGHCIDRVVALAPVGDLRAAHRDRLGDGAVGRLLGGGPDQVPDRYVAADPASLLISGSGSETRLIVVHGNADREVPVANSRGWVDGRPDVELRELDGVDHFAVIDPLSPAWSHVLRAISSG